MSDIIPQDAPQKQCPDCEKFFPATLQYFYRNGSKNSLSTRCKQCHITRSDETRRKNNNEERRAHHAAYEKARRLKDKEAFNKNRREREKAKREHINAYGRAYRQKHREVFLERRKRYRQSKRGLIIILTECRNRKARKREAQGTHTAQDVQMQYQRQKGRCYWCQQKLTKYHVDHVIPLSRGGSNGPENIVIACPTCNMSKHNKLPHEWPQGNRLL